MTQFYETTIAYPFSISYQGTVATATDQTKIWQDKVLSVVGTCLNERVMLADFGSEIYTAQYLTADDALDKIPDYVASAFHRWLPDLTLVSVDGSYDASINGVKVSITYRLPNKKQVTTALTDLTLNGSAPFKEV